MLDVVLRLVEWTGGTLMDPQYTFLAAVAFSIAVPCLVIAALWRPIYGILVDLCGTEVRARFWRTCSALALILTPLTVLFMFHTENPSHGPIFAIVDNARWSLAGLIVALFVVALGVASFIPARPPEHLRVDGEFRQQRRDVG